MRKIKELLVVEGKHDKARLDKLFDCDVVLTHGLSLDKDTLEVIKQAANKQGVIVISDPDNPGRKIRDQIVAYEPNVKHVFIDKKDAIGKRNVGIEYVSDDLLVKALEDVITFKDYQENISWSQYLDLGLVNNKEKRDYLTSQLKIGMCNNKRLYKYLNMLDISLEQIKQILEQYDRNH